ncbi:MAG: acetyl-CoA carboxylase biotin carboxyl carrier protein subunit [Acidobacteria bacterium]|nr:acetyl-CoA carboxylase biotin carboxyl carrier protein subunit [Acidobacteriota bacterium]
MKLKITVDEKIYEVEVEASEPEGPAYLTPGYVPPQVRVPAAGAPAFTPPPAPLGGNGTGAKEDKVCRSPIAGTVVKVATHAGQSIQVGDVLLVLEAMKMETNITAPIAGKVSKVCAGSGDAVQGGQVLVEFE